MKAFVAVAAILGDVGAGDEGAVAGAAQDQDADCRVRRDRVERRLERGDQSASTAR